MVKKILGGLAGAVAVIGLSINAASAAVMSTSTLGSAIDSINGTTYDYFAVLLEKYWPFLVGFGVLLVVWGFGKRIVQHFA